MTIDELNRHLDLVAQLKKAKDALESIECKALGAQSLDGNIPSSDHGDKVSSLAIVLAEQREDIKELQEKVNQSETAVKAYIDTISDSHTKLIFKLRFLCAYPWYDIAETIGGGNTPQAVKAVCYRYLTNNT